MKRLLALMILTHTAAVCAGAPFLPGQWDITVTMESIDGAAATPQMKQSFAKQKPRTERQCLTADQLMPSPEKLLKDTGGKCKATSFVLANGKMSSATTCSGHGPTITSTTSGTYDAKNYSFRSVSTIATPKGDLTTKVLTVGKWVGTCSAK